MSTFSSHPRLIVVLGATGHQGGGAVRALLKSKSWIVRAGTRDPGSSKAQKLLAQEQNDDGRLEVVAAHVYDIETLRKAFIGAYIVFAITSESHPDKKIVHEEEMQHEIEAGRNIVLAAKECNVTSGQFPKLYHMNNKHAIEKIAREGLPRRVTFIVQVKVFGSGSSPLPKEPQTEAHSLFKESDTFAAMRGSECKNPKDNSNTGISSKKGNCPDYEKR
ncbi:hypothetical protein P885DRAFT_59896 [Corynascus similis CBS 632.67]